MAGVLPELCPAPDLSAGGGLDRLRFCELR